jgi:hypothetical protein
MFIKLNYSDTLTYQAPDKFAMLYFANITALPFAPPPEIVIAIPEPPL